MSFVGKKFPNISVKAMNEMGDTKEINVFEEAKKNNKKVLLFWYPKDFTFVCPTELHAFQAALKEFEKRNTMVIGASCDTPEVHFAWLNTSKDNGGIEGVTYDIIADSNRNLASILDILDVEEVEYDEKLDADLIKGDYVTYRATYLIDEEPDLEKERNCGLILMRNFPDSVALERRGATVIMDFYLNKPENL